MNNHLVELQRAHVICQLYGWYETASGIARLMREEFARPVAAAPYGVLHPMQADRTAFEHVESPGLKVA